MKILFLSPAVPFPSDGGGKLRTVAILNALSKDNDVYFLALHDPDTAADYEELKKLTKDFKVVSHKQRFGWNDPFHKQVLRVIYLILGIPSPVIRNRNPEFASLVKNYAAELKPDLVIANFLWLAQYIKPLKGKFRRVLNAHNVESDAFRTTRPGSIFWLPWKIWERYESRTIGNFDLVFVTSENEKKRFLELYSAGRYFVVPNAVNTKLLRFNQHTHRGGLVFTGNLGHLPNVDAVIFFVENVLPLVKKKEPEVQLSIVGSDPFPEVVDLGKVLGVEVFSNVPDTKPYISGAAVAIVPIRSGSGTRLKILEAFALGTPVVSTSFGAEGLDVTPGSDILIADKPMEFANAIISLLKNKRRAEQLAVHARQTIESKYSWDAIEKKLERYYLAKLLSYQDL